MTVSHHLCHRTVGSDEATIRGKQDNADGRAVQCHAERLFAGPEGFFRQFQRRDVVNRTGKPNESPLTVEDRDAAKPQPDIGPILAPNPCLIVIGDAEFDRAGDATEYSRFVLPMNARLEFVLLRNKVWVCYAKNLP